MTSKQQVNAPLILTVGAISTMLLVVTMFGVEAWFRYEERGVMDARWAESRNFTLEKLRNAQHANIERSGVAPDGKTHLMKIEDAMQLVVKNGGKMPSTQPSK